MSFYEGLKNTASKLLQSRGQQVTVTRSVTSSFNPATGIETPASDVAFTGYGAAFNYNSSKIDGTLIQVGDIRFLFEATDIEPALGDVIVLDSDTYTVLSVTKTSPAGIAVMHELQLRK